MSEYEIQPFSRDGTFHYDIVEIREGKHPRWIGTYGSELGAERGVDLLRQQNAPQRGGIDSEIKSGWVPSPDRDELLKRIEYLEARLKAKGIEVKSTDRGVWIYSDRVLEPHEIDFVRDLLGRRNDE